MEGVHQGRRLSREMSPDRAKMCSVQTRSSVILKPTFKKVEVVYYLTRNGHLEHPHYMEVTHLAHQQLRLKDVMDRLTVLRGKGMPSLYSWSSKRSYKNGYVWNDLSQNDVIYPSQGGEYVLKGSELLVDCTEKLHHLQVANVQQFQHGANHQTNRDSKNFHPKRKHLATKRHPHHHQEMVHHPHEENVDQEEEDDEEEDEHEEKTTMHTTCSRGVSTDDQIEDLKKKEKTQLKNTPNELTLEITNTLSPPSTSSTLSDISSNTSTTISNNTSNKSENDDPVANEPMLSKNSMLFSLIACGGSSSFRKTAPPALPPCTVAPRKSCGGGISSLRKGVVCKAAVKMAAEEEEMIKYMSENPRVFGKLEAEEKEYFSGSIVEAIVNEERFCGEPALKKSSSFNQERSTKVGLVAEAAETQVKKEKGVKGKCIPRKKSSSKHPKK